MTNFADNFSDEDLRGVLRRALRLVLIAAAVAGAVLWIASGWRNALFLAVGSAVSATGVWEWQRLVTVLIAKMDAAPNGATEQKTTPRTGPIVAMFSLRMVLAAGVVYVTLKCCNGSVYALLGGLALSLLAMGFEGVKLLRNF